MRVVAVLFICKILWGGKFVWIRPRSCAAPSASGMGATCSCLSIANSSVIYNLKNDFKLIASLSTENLFVNAK